MASDRDPFLNPFTDPDRRAIWEMLVPRDIDAFVSADWNAVAGDFVSANFTGISGNFQPDPQGFTLAQYASALAANAAASTMRQPGNGWGTAAKPNGVARQHAAWFAAPAQAWLVPVAPAAAPAPAAPAKG